MRGCRLEGILRLLCAGVPLFGAAAHAATTYSVTNLGFLTGGLGTSEAVGINNYGQVVGTSDFTNGTETFLWTPTVANGKVGSLVNLGALSGGSGFNQPSGINDFGQVSGYTIGTSGQYLGTIWTPTSTHGTTGSLHALPTLSGEDFIQTQAINSFGQVVGETGASDGSVGPDGYLFKPTAMNGSTGVAFNPGNFANSDSPQEVGINNSGQIAGYSFTQNGTVPFVWTPTTTNGTSGTMTALNLLSGADSGIATGINGSGQIIGQDHLSSGGRGFIWTPTTPNGSTGTTTDLGNSPDNSSFILPMSINSSGTVVGETGFDPDGQAFIWTAQNHIVDLSTLLDSSGANWTLNSAVGINDAGQIVGVGMFDPDGAGPDPAVESAFLLTPTPEPAMGVVMLGFSAVLLRRRRAQ